MTNLSKILLAICFVLIPAVSFAQVTVNSLNDPGDGTCDVAECTFREAIDTAAPGSTIDFQPGLTGTITLLTGIIIEKELNIMGPGVQPGDDIITITEDLGDGSIPNNFVIRIDNGTAGDFVISGLRFADAIFPNGIGVIDYVNSSLATGPTSLTIENCFFENNLTGQAGAIATRPFGDGLGVFPPEIFIRNNTFRNNSGRTAGAVSTLNTVGIVEISNSTFESNTTICNGVNCIASAAVEMQAAFHSLTIFNSTFDSNMTMCNGDNCQAIGGVIAVQPGLIMIYPFANVDIRFNTFRNNSVSCTGVGCATGPNDIAFFVADDPLDDFSIPTMSSNLFQSSTISRNCCTYSNVTRTCRDDLQQINSLGHNLSDDGTCAFGGPGDMPFTNAVLDPLGLQDNGGMTETIALLPGSPAIDMADPAAVIVNDQRGVARPFNGRHDIGAFETQIANIDITKLTIPSGGIDNPFTSTGFTGITGCDIADNFLLDDMETATCSNLPFGTYNITETIPAGQVLTVVCEQLPETFLIDSVLGTLDFTIDETGGDVSCLFINSFANTVVRISEELPGVNCEFGGTIIESGLDTNQNGVLEDAEVIIDDTQFICNGAPGDQGPPGPPGMDGLNSLIAITDEPPGPDNCEFGGIRIDSGLDDDSSGTLDGDEIDTTAYVCNGAPGDNTLISVTAATGCPNGGFDINTGEDDNLDGVLDPGEIDNTSTICNGADGQDGTDGLSFLINVVLELAGPNCEFGGVRVDSGLDENMNMILDPLEVDDMNFICNGEPGAQGNPGQPGPPGDDGEDGMDGETPIIDLEPIESGPDSECPNGGVRIKTGIDINENGELDENEVQITEVVCNGTDGSTGTNSNCSLAGSGSSSASLAGMMLYILIPGFVLLRRGIRKRENK